MVFESIAGGLVKAVLPKVAGAIATAVKNKLNPTELEKALRVGLQKSGAFDRGQKVNNDVFYRCTDKEADTFLASLLEHPDVQCELQKPLEQDGAPDVAMLVQVAKHIAIDRKLSIDDKTLEPWLKAFANAYFDAITAIRFQVAKADYLEQLVNWFDDVKFAGVAVPGQDVERAERLAQIFVMPDVEEDRGQRSRLAFERSAFEEQGEQGRQGELLQEQRLRAQLERSGRKFLARQLLNQPQKKLVLLGAPGSGKTTLMSFFAVELAERQGAIASASDVSTQGLDHDAEGMDRLTEGLDHDRSRMYADAEGIDRDRSQMQRDSLAMYPDTEGLRLDTQGLQTDTDALPLPILIRIRDWARTPDVTLPEYARQFAETTMSCKPLPKGFFEHWLNNGRALILLDGLDEVAEESKRYHLVQCIENFLGQYPQNRAIITSRPAGYKRDFFRTEEFPHYELQPFDDGKIEEFCDRWYTSRVPDQAEAQRRKESLQKALNQQDRIKLLARNPLLLTIIALIHRYQARLPRERYKLYDKAVETLLTAWDDNKELSNQTVLKYLQLDDLRRLMESLAYWIHTQGNTGDTEGGTLIDKDELIQKLCQEIKTLKQLQHYEAKAEAERFVTFIRDRTGLLNEQGQDCYAFVHKTFQEYLAAQDINYQADNEDDFEIVLTHIKQHLHDAHWREVLLLLIAQQSPKKAARAIRKVLTANSPYEQWLHRDLLFAGRCLAEDPKGLQVADAVMVCEILDKLIALEIAGLMQSGSKSREEVFQVLCSLQESAFEADALQRLKQNANSINENCLRRYQAELRDVEAATMPLLTSLRSSDSDERTKATYELFKLGKASDAVLQALLDLLHDTDSGVRYRSAFALGNLRNASDTVQHRLLNLLQDANSKVRVSAAAALVKLGNTSDAVLQALLALLHDVNTFVRASAVTALSDLGNASDAVLQGLLNLLQDADSEVCNNAAFALSNLGVATDAVLQGLLALLQDTRSDRRASAADGLGDLGNVSDVVLQGLLNLLHDTDSWVRTSAVEALVKLGSASDALLQGILNLLQDEDSEVRASAAATLGDLENVSDVMLQRLLALLRDEDSRVRDKVAFALVNLGNVSDVLLQGLLALLKDAAHMPTNTAVALGNLAKRSNQVEPAIVQWIEQHQDEECVGAGIDALWEIVKGAG
jgi:HEAT repeat protein